MGITTDIIVGFPGETESDFEETVKMMNQVEFQNSYVYAFSPRPGTIAAQLKDDVPQEEKLRRLQHLQHRQEANSAKILARWIGKTVEVLVDGPSQHTPKVLHGRSSQSIAVNFDIGNLKIGAGDIVPVQVTAVGRFSLRGKV